MKNVPRYLNQRTELAMTSLPAVCADALVDIHFVDASPAVLARVAFAIVYI